MPLSINDLYRVEGTILLLGETGTGKSYLAKQIYENSQYKNGPFHTCHLSTMSEALIETELFGHVKGSFTGAVQDKKGQLELVAGGGVLFLDEIGELSWESQKKLLWPLEERYFSPLGSLQQKKFGGRIIAATNRNLLSMVDEGAFRKDLWERLKVFCYTVPPLRETPERLEEVIAFYLDFFQKKFRLLSPLIFRQETYDFLMSYKWSGNVREVKHVVEYVSSLAKGPNVDLADLPEWMFSGKKGLLSQAEKEATVLQLDQLPINYAQALHCFEENYLNLMLKKFKGHITQTATELRMSKSTLIAKAKKYGINTWAIRAQKEY